MGEIGKSFFEIETPGVLIDQTRLETNIGLIQELANSHRINVRPHIKTHKCLEIARLQMNRGAVGITASKTNEALVFINSGISSVTLAYPMVMDSKLDRLLETSRSHDIDLRLIIDGVDGMEAISRSGKRHRIKINVFLKVDVGLHRCGVKEGDPLLMSLAHEIDQDPSLNFLGLLSHAGHVYGAQNSDQARKITQDESAIMSRVRRQIEGEGIEIREVSVGSTPTVLACENFEEITEIRPGNYVFMDRTPLRLGLVEPDRIALSVLTMVISANSDFFIIDAGSKVLSSDLGAHGIDGVKGYGLAYPVDRFQEKNSEMIVTKLSEEHGFVPRGGFDMPIGSRLRIIPNHACPIANLADTYIVAEDNRVVDQWKIAARGQVL